MSQKLFQDNLFLSFLASRAGIRYRAAFVESSHLRGNMSKRIMVDMSATLIHHGHVRLLKKAAELDNVVVALTTNEEVKKPKAIRRNSTTRSARKFLKRSAMLMK
jgi:cytidyltransferase-like protein